MLPANVLLGVWQCLQQVHRGHVAFCALVELPAKGLAMLSERECADRLAPGEAGKLADILDIIAQAAHGNVCHAAFYRSGSV